MRSVSVLLLGLALCFFVGTSMAKVLFINQFPHFQTFDSWNNCYYDGTCYENRCDSLSAGWYNPEFRAERPSGTSIRHWWVSDTQTPSNWNSARQPVACSSLRTGPCTDHTAEGEINGGKFLYAEATACFGVQFEVRTPTFMFNNSGGQISFWYYMWGTDMGATAELSLDLSINNGSWVNVWSVTGSQGQAWRYRNVEIADTIGNNATHADPTPVTFRFVAITTDTRDEFYSDIAIDDVYVTQDGAPNTSEPYIQPNDTKPPPVDVPSPVASKEGGDGLTDEEIIGIVIGIVGGACCICFLCILCLIALLLIISPRHPPEEQNAGL